MAEVSVLHGLGSDERGDLRTAYPVNLVPVPYGNDLSIGFLRPAEGIVEQAATTAPGVDRGGRVWRDVLYRVLGTSFCSIATDGSITAIATVAAGPNRAQFADSFDNLAITSGGLLYLYNGITVTQVTDSDLGTGLSVIFVDGYFMTTDGEALIVTELNDPTQVDPLKYGSAEQDPDPIQRVLRVRNEPVAVGRHTLEWFINQGGTGFPFQRIDGALVTKGAIGPDAACVHALEQGDVVAFVGSAKGEPPSVYLASNATCVRIATQEIDTLLQGYSEADLYALCCVESRIDRGHEWLYVHLPDRTIVYDGAASRGVGEPVWFVLTSTLDEFQRYQARSFVWAYDRWNVADPTSARIGYVTREVGEHYSAKVRWEFSTGLMQAQGKGGQVNELELISLTGRVAVDADPIITTQYSTDGETWSTERLVYSGRQGRRNKRLAWRSLGLWRTYRIHRFRGDTQSHLSFVRLEVTAEGLLY